MINNKFAVTSGQEATGMSQWYDYPSNLSPNGYIRLTFFLFSEWNGRLEIKDLRREMRRDLQNIKTLIVNGNPSEKEDE